MGKQFEFYSHKNDDEMIANTLRSVFGELLCVPHYKGDLSLLLTFVLMTGRCI